MSRRLGRLPHHGETYLDMSCWVWDSLNHVLQQISSVTVRSEPETAGRQKGTINNHISEFCFP